MTPLNIQLLWKLRKEANYLEEQEEASLKWKNLSWVLKDKRGFLGGSDGKESAHNARDLGSVPGSVRSLGERNGYPIQCSCLESSVDRGAL